MGTLTLVLGTAGVDAHKTMFCQTSTHDNLYTKLSVSTLSSNLSAETIPFLNYEMVKNIRAHFLWLFLLIKIKILQPQWKLGCVVKKNECEARTSLQEFRSQMLLVYEGDCVVHILTRSGCSVSPRMSLLPWS